MRFGFGLWLGVDVLISFKVDYDIEGICSWNQSGKLLIMVTGEVTLEYKIKEPRQYLLLGNAFRSLFISSKAFKPKKHR
jgi:hypothetical protein